MKTGHGMSCVIAAILACLGLTRGSAAEGPNATGVTNPFFAMCTGTRDAAHETFAAQADMLKELGYQGTDQMGTAGIPELLAELDERGLRFFAVYTEVKIDPDGPQWDTGLEDAIEALKGRDAVLWLPVTSKRFAPSSPKGDEDAVAVIRRVAEMGAKSGLRVALYPHTGHWLERVEDAVRVAQKVNRPDVGVTFNLCHWLKVDGEDLRAKLELAKPHLFMVTVNGAEVGGTDWSTLIQTLDQGTFDVCGLLGMLKEMDYKGPIGLQGYGIGGDVSANLLRSMDAWRICQKRIAVGGSTNE
ncbi:MAG: sugar phosphate isomerase/epimerase [Candidatus Hydrogenedentes bacterium]|nr:sugar phosphate isomerase/epimerase [Candidatus Hydrogenedentota bacterium]